jgi:hypothetical protein
VFLEDKCCDLWMVITPKCIRGYAMIFASIEGTCEVLPYRLFICLKQSLFEGDVFVGVAKGVSQSHVLVTLATVTWQYLLPN